MTSVWPNPRLAFLLLLIPLLAPAGQATDDAWVVEGTEHCRDEVLRVGSDIRIVSGGSLVLEGCTLIMEVPPYEDRWLHAEGEGLLIHIEEGGRLEMRSGDNPSHIKSNDARHGYRIEVHGMFISNGADDRLNTIRHLEGYMAEAFIGGGLQAIGSGAVYLNHTRLEDLQGPALFAWDGGQGHVRESVVYNASGAFAAINATLHVKDSELNTGIESMRVSRSTLRLDSVHAEAQRIAVHATRSDVLIRDSWLQAGNAAISLAQSNARIEDSAVEYVFRGVVHEERAADSTSSVEMRRTKLSAIKPDLDSLGVHVAGADLIMVATETRNNTLGGVAAQGGGIIIQDSKFYNLGAVDVYARNPTWIDLDGNTPSPAAAQLIRVFYSLEVQVIGHDGEPVEDAWIEVDGRGNRTDKNGSLDIVWWPPTDDTTHRGEVPVLVTVDGTTRSFHISPDTRTLVADFSREPASAEAALPGLPLGLFAIAGVAWARRKFQ